MQIIPGTTGVSNVWAGVRPAETDEVRRVDEAPPIPPPRQVHNEPNVVRQQKDSDPKRFDIRA